VIGKQTLCKPLYVYVTKYEMSSIHVN